MAALILMGLAVGLVGCSDWEWYAMANENNRTQQDVIQTAETQQPQAAKAEEPAQVEMATFGAGCFWGVEAAFRQVPGVVDTAVGYMGGHVDHPTYKQVCTDRTGHAEVVHVQFDPAKVSYEQLLEVFWGIHNPTTLNRQGPDIGKQYRSVIFVHSRDQAEVAKESKKQQALSGNYSKPIVTAIEVAKDFWRAEEYHQRYYEKTGRVSCPTPH